MPLSLYYEWMAYDRLFPFGEERQDWRMAMMAQTMANVHRGKRRPYKLSRFHFGIQHRKYKEQKQEAEARSPSQTYKMLRLAFTLAYGDSVIRKKKS